MVKLYPNAGGVAASGSTPLCSAQGDSLMLILLICFYILRLRYATLRMTVGN